MKLKFTWGWKYLDYGIVLLGIFVAGAVWFIPNFENNPDVQGFYARQRVLKAERLRIEAAEKRIKDEEERLGIIWVPPPPPKAKATPAPGEKPAKGKTPAKAPAKKPAEKPAAKPN